METRTENLRRTETESECDSVFASENESIQTAELPTRKQKSCIDAVIDEGKDDLSGSKLFMVLLSKTSKNSTKMEFYQIFL